MKRILILCFLLIGFIGHSQSKRKINKQLRAEYAVLDAQVDDFSTSYGKEMSTGNELMKVFREKTEKMIRKENDYLELLGNVRDLLADIKTLEVKPAVELRQSFIDSTVLPNRVEYFDHLVRRKQVGAFFGFEKQEIPQMDNYSIAEQNNVFQVFIDDRNDELVILNDAYKQLLECKAEMMKADSVYDILNQFMDRMTPALLLIRTNLETEMSKQRQLYKEKGPKGFSEAYQQLFPDVFPELTKKEVASENESFRIGNNEFVADIKGENETFVAVDKVAEFVGGQKAMYDYLKKNLNYPQEAKELNLQGKCIIRFVVSKTGEITNVTVQQGVTDCLICDREAMRVVKMMPNWIPAEMNDVAVNSEYNIPINFHIE